VRKHFDVSIDGHVGSDAGMDAAVDSRAAYAKAASRGFGMGQFEARRFIAEQSSEDIDNLRASLVDDVERSQTLGQRRSVPLDEYVRELVAKGQLEEQPNLDLVYRAGFDIGFRAYVVESLTAAEGAGESIDTTPALGASDTIRMA
jgi:hypothetical protein